MLDRIPALLRISEPLLPEEILDTLWLATRLRGAEPPLARLRAAALEAGKVHSRDGPHTPAVAPSAEPVPLGPTYPASAAPPPERPGRRGGSGSGGRDGYPGSSVAVSLPTERPLARERDIGHALHPLKRTRPSSVRQVLDEVATAEAFASGHAHPVLRPARERWLRLALVIDGGTSMLLWRRLADHLRQILERTGGFRHIQVHGLRHPSSRSEPLALIRPFEIHGRAKSPHSLVDPTAQTVVLLLTDGAGNAWKDGRMRAAVDAWARTGPTAILQTLPSQLWPGSALRTAPWNVHARHPAGPNTGWDISHPVLPVKASTDYTPVPVLDLTPIALSTWTQAVTAREERVELPLWTDVPAGTGDITPPSARARLDHFVRTASPDAKRLAGHLAALAPLTVPVMDLVRAALFRDAGTVVLAEVVLAGLLRVEPHDNGAVTAPQHQFFTFDEDIGPLLAETVPPQALQRCHDEVSRRIELLVGTAPEFTAWLHEPGTLSMGTPFASMRRRPRRPSLAKLPVRSRPRKPPSWKPHVFTALPPIRHDMAGRTNELNRLLATMDPTRTGTDDELLVICGVPGVGKTTLALTAAHHAQDRHWFDTFLILDLHDDDAPALDRQALEALLVALGVPDTRIPHSTDHRADLYRHTLAALGEQGHRVLVIADNAPAGLRHRALIPGGPHVLLRCAQAGLDDEAVPHIALDRLLPDASGALIAESLKAVEAADTRVEDEPDATRRLAALCGYLPLALRLAAGILTADPTRSIGDLAGRLARTAANDNRDDASGPIEVVLDEIHRLLSPAQAGAFRRLAVHPGPDISLDAAALLVEADHRTTHSHLRFFHEAGLLGRVDAPSGPRWSIHNLVRAYVDRAHRFGTETAESDRARAGILQYYGITAAAAVEQLASPDSTDGGRRFATTRQALVWLDEERACLIAMVHMAVDVGNSVGLALTLGPYLERRRHFDDWHTVSAMARDFYQALPDPRAEAAAWNNLGQALRGLRRFDESTHAFRRAEELFRRAGETQGRATAYNNLGLTLHDQRHYEEAVTALHQAVDLWRRVGVRHGLADALNNLGLALYGTRRSGEARTALLEAEQLAFEVGDTRTLASVTNNLGLAERRAGNLEEALAAHRRALVLQKQRTDDQAALAEARGNLGLLLWDMGRHEDALHELRRALELFTRAGDRHGQAIAWNNVGLALTDTRRFEEAADAHHCALELFLAVGDKHGLATARDNRGVTLRRLGRVREAADEHTCAAQLFRETGDLHSRACALGNLGSALSDLGSLGEALGTQEEAYRLFVEIGDRSNEAYALANLSGSLLGLGETETALARMTDALELLRDVSDVHTEAIVWQKFALVLQASHRPTEALDAHEQAVHAARLSRNSHLEATALANFAIGLELMERSDEALGVYEQAVQAFTHADEPAAAAHVRDLWQTLRSRTATATRVAHPDRFLNTIGKADEQSSQLTQDD